MKLPKAGSETKRKAMHDNYGLKSGTSKRTIADFRKFCSEELSNVSLEAFVSAEEDRDQFEQPLIDFFTKLQIQRNGTDTLDNPSRSTIECTRPG